MTDRERLLALLSDFGIEPRANHPTDDPTDVNLEAHEGGVKGYSGFVCSFGFAEDGSFKDVGVWE